MGNKKGDLKTILLNVLSNIIFQIGIMLVSGGGISLIVLLLREIHNLQNQRFTISVLSVVFLGICVVIFMIAGGMFIHSVTKKITSNKINSKERASDFYFSYYEKNITIYKNGNGIIKHKFKIVVNDKSRFQQLRKKINISDGKKTSAFPSLDKMKQTPKDKRFSDFGFWYQSDDGIISEVKEFYWNNFAPDREDKDAKNNPQELRWLLLIDRNKLEERKPYEVSYIISVPGLAALENGCLNKKLQKDENEDRNSSSMRIRHNIKHFKYIVSFEDGVSIDVPPRCERIIDTEDGMKTLDNPGNIDYDLLYTKYIYDIENPEFNSNIRISWKYNVI